MALCGRTRSPGIYGDYRGFGQQKRAAAQTIWGWNDSSGIASPPSKLVGRLAAVGVSTCMDAHRHDSPELRHQRERGAPMARDSASARTGSPAGDAARAQAVLRLEPAQLLELADLIAERLHRETPSGLVDAASLARLLGVSRTAVYEHAAELGAIEVGDGERPRLRFDVDRALQAWARRKRSGGSHSAKSRSGNGIARRRRAPRLGSSATLLPIADRNSAHR